jgi:hypothetical protein
MSDESKIALRWRGRRGATVASALALAIAVACGDPYLHTNPYDGLYPVAVTVNGPDTVLSFGQTAQYVGSSNPAFPDTAFSYGVTDSIAFSPASVGAFIANSTPLWPLYTTVTVIVGVSAYDTIVPNPKMPVGPGLALRQYRHASTKTVVLTQRVVRIQLRCPDTHACGTVPVGGTWAVWADGLDALNEQIVALHSLVANPATGTPVATYSVRDTTIASFAPVGIRAATVTALKTGTTWIIGTRGSLSDSLQLVVQ